MSLEWSNGKPFRGSIAGGGEHERLFARLITTS
jgi:hypothetical protein